MIRRFFQGFNFVFRGRVLLSEVPTIKFWVMFPFFIHIILLALGLYFGAGQLQLLLSKVTSFIISDPTTLLGSIVYAVMFVFSFLIFCILYIYFVYILAQIIAAPFYSLITEKTLHHLGLNRNQKNIFQSLSIALKMFGVSLLRSFVLLGLGVLLFLFSFIPILNFVAAYFVFVILVLDSADYAFEAVEMKLSDRWQFFRQNTPEFLGMATFVGLTALLPGLILFVMPMAVLGSTELVATKLKHQTTKLGK